MFFVFGFVFVFFFCNDISLYNLQLFFFVVQIEKAYQILVNETTCKEGFDAALYANIRKPQSEQHIKIITKKVDFLDALIRRAEPEVNGR